MLPNKALIIFRKKEQKVNIHFFKRLDKLVQMIKVQYYVCKKKFTYLILIFLQDKDQILFVQN